MSNEFMSSSYGSSNAMRYMMMNNPNIYEPRDRKDKGCIDEIQSNLYQMMMLPRNQHPYNVPSSGNIHMQTMQFGNRNFTNMSAMDLYNLECLKRYEAEQLAKRRRQLECLQSFEYLQNSHINRTMNQTSASTLQCPGPATSSTVIPSLVNLQEPPFISTSGTNDDDPPTPESHLDDASEIINIDKMSSRSGSSTGSYSDVVTSVPPLDMEMPPLTRIVDEFSFDEDSTNSSTDEPSAKKAKIRCTICGENAICKSYGAVCCDSCRLFFRRTIVKEAHTAYTCSEKRKCIVTGRHRSRCKYCRFQRCLLNGMKPEYVLKNSNFKNITSKDLLEVVPADHQTSPVSDVANFTMPKYHENLSNNEAFEVHGIILQYERMRNAKTPAPMSKIDLVIDSFKDILATYLSNNLFSPSSGLEKSIVKSILNDSLTGALILRMAYHYDPVVHGLPHCTLFSPDKLNTDFSRQRVIPVSLHEDVLRTLKSIHNLKIDNTIVCLLILIYISHTDSSFEFYMSGSDENIDKFTILLKKYISSIHGSAKASDIFPKLLLKLADIKELQHRLDRYVMPTSLQ